MSLKMGAFLAGAALLAALAPASAKGCNGVVNQMEWGCAAWDNNNGPQYPHWRGATGAPPAAVGAGQGNGIISTNGAGIVSTSGAGIISTNGGGLVGNSGGTMRH